MRRYILEVHLRFDQMIWKLAGTYRRQREMNLPIGLPPSPIQSSKVQVQTAIRSGGELGVMRDEH